MTNAMSEDARASKSPPDPSGHHLVRSGPFSFPPSPADNELRLSSAFASRAFAAMSLAFLGGGVLGGYHGSTMASLRFRAENSHRFPTTMKGWYLYHKSKNYHCMLNAVKQGLRLGPRLAGWTGGFLFLEEAVDHWRGSRDAISSVVAGLALSGIFSIRRES